MNPVNLANDRDICCICLDEFRLSFGRYVNTFSPHSLEDDFKHRIHYECLIGLFKESVRSNTKPVCPMCREPFKMRKVIDIAKYTLQRCRATENTPGSEFKACHFLLPGNVVQLDVDFANKILNEIRNGDDAILPLISSTVDYWESSHSP